MAPLSNESSSFSGTTSDRAYINLTDKCSEDVLKALSAEEQANSFFPSDYKLMEYANQSVQSIFTTQFDPKECSNLTMGRLSDHERRKEIDNDSVESEASEADTFHYEVEGRNETIEQALLSWEPSLPAHPLDEPRRGNRRQSLDSMRAYIGDYSSIYRRAA
mmetsp:Transcript_30030/g.49606  ORF Transcript_30030/g.49606 Transcript_30030/m.49606 type:complete len:162 (-) Transcript_30030:57-542(-)|eukprot:CAMPEP_0119005072 /NCGR_PEP_ID=MMETSP1176-20130426/1512_1 /TAXON_ID=265551 /ORGANISM="Synedropsis recta cf, Strain CCMP1620" /LENGTH=161 /DNA_ID=CAMNT_0006956839 /DNA_START=69 /DNA_END=554 /DNA_ORIENTATION=-